MSNKRYHLFWPFIPKEDILTNINDTLNSRWIGQGPKVDQFEDEFREKFGYKHALFVNSGTAALELAYHVIGITEGDEVIVPVLNCTAGQTGLSHRKAKIIFADINRGDLNINLEDVKRKITKKTKAVIAVALGGIDIDPELYPYLKNLGIPLIIDSAQHHAHQKADFICYSFQAIKHITTGDGGILISSDENNHYRAKLLRWFGIDRELKAKHNWKPWERRKATIDITEVGYKYQPTDIDACFGLAGLAHLDEVISYRKYLVGVYRSMIKAHPDIHAMISGGSCWLFAVLVNRRDELSDYLSDKNIETNMVHLRNDIFSCFGGKRWKLDNMDWIEDKYLYLPLHTNLTPDDVIYISEKINEFYGSS